jgi:hypothetical protein
MCELCDKLLLKIGEEDVHSGHIKDIIHTFKVCHEWNKSTKRLITILESWGFCVYDNMVVD